ncbi:membrane protein [Paractinoplanes deccanensis]|uniref:Membrane protein n=1 Tax=Paractinoplanes deccanensis TaxID=113561 RepID=A0ABQ3Y4F0_9ACTN|nr:GAP family protein [Actinoplanes deccanensis]GID74869.1 membrane protein [Actinoplanes deccanensis]
MGEAIGQSLATAVGVALSPVPIIAVILMLTTPRARSNGPAFLGGWILGLAAVGTVVLLVAGPSATSGEEPATWVGWLKLALGALLLLVAVRQFRGRPRHGAEAAMPAWMNTIDHFGTGKSLAMGAALSGANPKNLLLAVAGASAIAQTGIPGGEQAAAYAIFAVVGSLGVAAPLVLYFALGKRSASMLAELKDWMAQHNAVIMAVLCLVIGAKLIGDALTLLG